MAPPRRGDWVAVGLDAVGGDCSRAEPDGHGGHELTKFDDPTASTASQRASEDVGRRPIMFAVDDIDDV